MKLNDDVIKSSTKNKQKTKVVANVPDYIFAPIEKNKNVLANFNELSNNQKNEYIEWIEEAKTETTRKNRMGTLEWVAEDKIRHWKYAKKL